MKPPRGLSADEAALWQKVTATVQPLRPGRQRKRAPAADPTPEPLPLADRSAARGAAPLAAAHGLDASWDRRLRDGAVPPDFRLDLHGLALDAAHERLESGLAQARAMGARLVLVVTGKPRPVEAADRGAKRGAIRAKILDWLALGAHAGAIAAIRQAHRRHGGDGALYLVLRKER